MSDKPKFPRADALRAAKEICDSLKPVCERLIVAGSLRRRKEYVGDVEILFVPRFHPIAELAQADFLSSPSPRFENLAETAIERLVSTTTLIQRKNINGSVTWGPKNKYALHVSTGIPVDLFTATTDNWYNYLVCRTGSAENNARIASAALNKGWEWHPYDHGFTDQEGNWVPVETEQDVFRHVGLPYLEPHER
jgi:DNA polymerase/3'-5' exonuclease PolX